MSHSDNDNLSRPIHGYFDSEDGQAEPRPCVPIPHPRTETAYLHVEDVSPIHDWEGVVHDDEFELLRRLDEVLERPEHFVRRQRPRRRSGPSDVVGGDAA